VSEAVTQATFSGLKIVQGRKVAQLIFEIAIEQADTALEALGGLPRSDNPRWCAICRLNLEAKPTDATDNRGE
jgi:hypothetical protein